VQKPFREFLRAKKEASNSTPKIWNYLMSVPGKAGAGFRVLTGSTTMFFPKYP
jgi:hypothetical protein